MSTWSWGVRGWALVVAAVLLAPLAAGCGRVVAGTAAGADATPPVPLADLLIQPDRFPEEYLAAVLDGTAVHRALRDVDGVAAGSVVSPPECEPVPLSAHDTVAAQGIDSRTATSLIVTLTRPAPPLTGRGEQLRRCPEFTTAHSDDQSTVGVRLLAAPPVDADDSYAVDQTVRSVPPGRVRRTLTLLAQVDDVRISATWLQDGTATAPDTTALDGLFRDAVTKVRRAG